MRELSDVMHEALERRSRALQEVTLDDARLGTLRSRVRRRRAVRHAAEAVVAVPVAAVLAVGGYWLVADRPDPVPPVETPVVTPTPSPEPTEPDPEPSETEATAPDPVQEPGFPTYHELPDGMLDQAGPGWVLATLVPRTVDVGASTHTEEGLFLVRPDGTRFLLHRFATGLEVDQETARWTQHDVVSWDPGARTALLHQSAHRETYAGPDVGIEGASGAVPGPVVEVDLVTGERTTYAEPPAEAGGLVGAAADGRLVWHTPLEGERPLLLVSGRDGDRAIETRYRSGGLHSISPDGRSVALGSGEGVGMFEVVDLDTGEVRGGGPVDDAFDQCAPAAWWTVDTVLATCRPAGADSADVLVTFDPEQVAAGRGTVLEPRSDSGEVRFTYPGAYVADGAVVLPGADATSSEYFCHSGAYLVDAGSVTRLVDTQGGAVVTPTVAGSTVYVSTDACWGQDPRSRLLLAHDLTTGTTTELVGPPVEPEGHMTTVDHAVAR